MCMCRCNHDVRTSEPRRRFRPLRMLFHLALSWALLVFAGGTLINTGHPIAVEVGRILHIVMFIDPAIGWTTSQGYEALAGGLRMLGNGIPLA